VCEHGASDDYGTVARTYLQNSLTISSYSSLSNSQQLEAPVPTLWLRDWLLISSMACLALVMGLYSPPLALAGLGILFAGLIIGDHVALVLLPLLVVMPLDLRINVGSQAAFLDLAYGILAIPLLRKLLADRHRVNLLPLAPSGFVIMAVLTTYYRSDKVSWMLENGLRLEIALIFAAVIASYGEVESIILAAGWSLPPVLSYGIYQMMIGGRGPLYDLLSGKSEPGDASTEWTGRPFSTFAHPNGFGFYCAIVTAMLFSVTMRSDNGLKRKLATGLSFLGVIGVLSSDSRGAWIGLAAVVVILTLVGYLRARYLLIGTVLALLILYALSALNPAGFSHASEFGEETVGSRMQLWRAAILMFFSHPLTGIGWINFTARVNSFIDWRTYPTDHAHNIYLSYLAETGVIGFILFFVPIAVVLGRSAKSCRSSTASLAGFLGLVVFLVHGMVDLTFYAPQPMLVFGVALGLASRTSFSRTGVLRQ
jgi:O-Antigen ligase